MKTEPKPQGRAAALDKIARHPDLAEAILEIVEPHDDGEKKRRVRRTPTGAKYLGHHQ